MYQKKHWFYTIGPNKYLKNIGFTVSVQESIKKALVLQYRSKKVSTKHWFYSIGPRKYQTNTGFIMFSFKHVGKPMVLQAKRP